MASTIDDIFGLAPNIFSPSIAAEAGAFDWSTWIVAGAAVVTAVATVALFRATQVLSNETKRMRISTDQAAIEASEMRELTNRIHAWEVQVHEVSSEPHFIIYVEVDEIENFEYIVFENVTENPAYDVTLRFDPDIVLNVYKPHTGNKNPRLSEIGFHPYSVVAPRQRIIRMFSVVTDGSGDFDYLTPFKDVKVEVSYRRLGGDMKTVTLHLDSNHGRKEWWVKKNTLIALQKQIKESLGKLSDSVLKVAGKDQATLRSLAAKERLQARQHDQESQSLTTLEDPASPKSS